MKKTTIEQLNSAAMQIILHAGDCRNLLNEAVNALLEDKSEEDIKAKITAAKKRNNEGSCDSDRNDTKLHQ